MNLMLITFKCLSKNIHETEMLDSDDENTKMLKCDEEQMNKMKMK